jgi:hypothetical protein
VTGNGAAVRLNKGSVFLEDVTMFNNSAVRRGGACGAW